MPLSQADRIAFSLQIVSAPSKVAALTTAKSQLSAAIAAAQSLDTANANLFNGPNVLVTSYQTEASALDGNGRATIAEQDIQDSANKKLQNHFFPNDTTATVPSLSANHNIWTQLKPYALTYAIGKNYSEAYTAVTKEGDLINAALALITSASVYVDIENTSGQNATLGQAAHCSNPSFTSSGTCTAGGGTWFPASSDSIQSFAAVVTLKANLVAAINSLVTFLTTEVAGIVTTDTNTGRQTDNNAAIANINTTFQPALSTWLGYADFNPVPGSVTTYAAFYAYNSNLLAPTKLHSAQLTALTTALNARLTFITTRLSQLTTTLGSITQDVTTGTITASSGLYGQRYGYLALRLGALDGSLTQLAGMQASSNAQNSIIASTQSNSNTYASACPTSALAAAGNGTAVVHLVDASFLSQGDAVYIYAEGQDELQRAVKSINNDAVTLNDVVPAKYLPASGARLYKDAT